MNHDQESKWSYRMAVICAAIAIPSAVLVALQSLDIVTLPAWVPIAAFPYLMMPLAFLMLFPAVYLTAFCLWHFRARYAGNHPVVWAFAVACSIGAPLFALIPMIAYLIVHVLPDMREAGTCQPHEPTAELSAIGGISERGRDSWRATFGWALIAMSVFISIVIVVAHYAIFRSFDARVRSEIGITLKEEVARVLLLGTTIHTVLIFTVALATLTAAIGGWLIFQHAKHLASDRGVQTESNGREIGKAAPNHTSDGIRQPADGLPKPSM